jgi:hypothetical protein
MIPRPFPRRITFDLHDVQRSALEYIAQREHYESSQELLTMILGTGIVMTLKGYGEMKTSKASFPFDRPGKAYRDRRRAMLEEIKRDDPSLADVALADNEIAPGRRTEGYVGAPLGRELRERFERWLDEHPEVSEENALMTLLERALTNEEKGKSPRAARSPDAQLRQAERQYRRELTKFGG